MLPFPREMTNLGQIYFLPRFVVELLERTRRGKIYTSCASCLNIIYNITLFNKLLTNRRIKEFILHKGWIKSQMTYLFNLVLEAL